MEPYDVIATLSALGQITRLKTFRALLRHEPHGMTESELQSLLKISGDGLSEQLSVLIEAGLATSAHVAHDIVYRARAERLREIDLFFVKDYPARFEHCARLAADVVNATEPQHSR